MTGSLRSTLLALAFLLTGCGPEKDSGPESRAGAGAIPAAAEGRMITADLWSGAGGAVRGPVPGAHPVDGRAIQAYHRQSGERRQVLTVTQDGAALGRVSDQRPGLPEQRFTGDVVFPLGLWRPGEARSFPASEITLFGPAMRQIELRILDLAFEHEGVPGSLRFRLATRDAAGRLLACETSVYSPGRGLVAFDAGTLWKQGGGC